MSVLKVTILLSITLIQKMYEVRNETGYFIVYLKILHFEMLGIARN